jgi:Amt family ammonium transporter
MGGVTFMAQLIGTGLGILVALIGAGIVYGVLKAAVGIRLDQEQEFDGSDLSIHKIGSEPHREGGWFSLRSLLSFKGADPD